MAKSKKGVRKGRRKLPVSVAKNAQAIRQIRFSQDKKLREATHTLTPAIDGTLGGPLLLSEIANGDDNTTRDGNTISHLGTFMKGQVFMNPAATVTHARIRVMIVRQKNNQTPAFVGVLKTATLDSYYSDAFNTLSKVVYDKTFFINDELPAKPIKIAVMKKFNIKYSGANGTDVAANNLYMMAICDQAVAGDRPTVAVQMRLRYTDS